jgi:hypothetical protein
MKFEISQQNVEKYSGLKFYYSPFGGSRVVSCGQTDRHDEANGRFLKFCERAQN